VKELKLNETEVEILFEQDPSTEKDGGWQGLLVRLQRSCDQSSGIIKVADKDLLRIPRYAFDMGQGGWQDKLVRIFGRTLGQRLGR